jgi:hypothetical protein
VLFVYMIFLKVALGRPALCAVCVHRNIICSIWKDLNLVPFVYIIMLKVAFGETFFGFCLYTSYC